MISAGFWPGGGPIDGAAFYSYTVPQPPGLSDEPVKPAAAFWSKDLSEYLLMYDEVRRAESPRAMLLDFLESTYAACLQYELNDAGYRCSAQVGLPVVYRAVRLDLGYRMDLVVEDLVVVEIKSVDAISPVHQAQILSYLKLSGKSIGLLINFNVIHLKDGIKRFVNGTGWK